MQRLINVIAVISLSLTANAALAQKPAQSAMNLNRSDALTLQLRQSWHNVNTGQAKAAAPKPVLLARKTKRSGIA